jgi:hypothetical protein
VGEPLSLFYKQIVVLCRDVEWCVVLWSVVTWGGETSLIIIQTNCCVVAWGEVRWGAVLCSGVRCGDVKCCDGTSFVIRTNELLGKRLVRI